VYEQAMRDHRRFLNRSVVALLAVLAVSMAACGLAEDEQPLPTPTPTFANLLANPGFEAGSDPWTPPTADARAYAVVDSVARGGTSSLELRLASDDAGGSGAATGALQTISSTTTFPEFASGFVRFEEWEQSDPPQFAEFVVTVRGGDFADGLPEHQVRFALAGLPAEPLMPAGSRFLFLNRDDPEKLNEWVYFGYPVRDAFQGRLGQVPTTWESIEFSVQLRHAPRAEGAPASSASVYFDDLYVGSQIDDVNRPLNAVLPDS
jgi:hypothetical protein